MSFLETAWVSWAIAIVAVVIVYIAKTYTFWARQGVVQTWPRPIFGDVWDAFIRRCSLGDLLIKMYRKYNDVPFVGFYKFLTPAILVRDPDLVKEVLSQNFASFQNNETILKEGADVLMSENPFAVGMDRWKDLRMRISTLFNPSRTRLAFDELLASSDHLVQFLKDSGPDKVQDGFEIARRYTAYASARVLFGIESNSLEVNSPPGTFFDAGMALFNGGLLNALRFTAFFYSPFWLKVIGSTFASESTFLFFRNLIRDSIEYRQKHNINRDDFIEYASKQVYADGEINDKLLNKLTSQAVNSFSETFETSGITVGATLLLLATNPDKQNKLRADLVKATMGKKLTLDDINGLPYLDWVVKEMLRLFPILDTTRRRCTQATTLGSGATAVQLQPGTPVYIPVLALHYDPTLYERPEDFHPEHFSPEQVAARPKCTFLGFGEGPRACPGSRYAYVLVKVALAQVVLNFRLLPGPQVVLPIKRDPTANFVNFLGGNWIQFKPLA